MNDTVSPEEQIKVDELYNRMAAQAVDWTIEQFASKAVELLILDEGHLNKYQRTIETVLTVFERAAKLRAGPMAEAKQKALDLALARLIKHEPGDSRAVSDEFVAMADIAANQVHAPGSVLIVMEALDREKAMQPNAG